MTDTQRDTPPNAESLSAGQSEPSTGDLSDDDKVRVPVQTGLFGAAQWAEVDADAAGHWDIRRWDDSPRP